MIHNHDVLKGLLLLNLRQSRDNVGNRGNLVCTLGQYWNLEYAVHMMTVIMYIHDCTLANILRSSLIHITYCKDSYEIKAIPNSNIHGPSSGLTSF